MIVILALQSQGMLYQPDNDTPLAMQTILANIAQMPIRYYDGPELLIGGDRAAMGRAATDQYD